MAKWRNVPRCPICGRWMKYQGRIWPIGTSWHCDHGQKARNKKFQRIQRRLIKAKIERKTLEKKMGQMKYETPKEYYEAKKEQNKRRWKANKELYYLEKKRKKGTIPEEEYWKERRKWTNYKKEG